MTIQISGSSGIQNSPGTAAVPSYGTNSGNTGMFFPSNAAIAFSTYGTQVMLLDSTGNLTLTGNVIANSIVSNSAVTVSSIATTGNAVIGGNLSVSGTASIAALNLGTVLATPAGGTGQSSYTIGDILYASGTTTLSRLADVATGNVLLSGGVGVAPSWGQVSLTTTVTGILPAANGGTGVANSSTITLGGNLTISGAFATTLTVTGTTNITLPTSGTLVNTAVTTLSSLASVGTITSGTWNASVIGVAAGGTGASGLTANNVLLGNGTSALQVVAPGTSGNVLASNGTTWVSSTPAASGPSKAQAIAYSMILGF